MRAQIYNFSANCAKNQGHRINSTPLISNNLWIYSLLCKRSYNRFYVLSQSIGLLHGRRLGIDAYYRFGIGLAQMNPAVGEVNLHTVDVGYRFGSVTLLYSLEYCVDINVGVSCILFFAMAYSG